MVIGDPLAFLVVAGLDLSPDTVTYSQQDHFLATETLGFLPPFGRRHIDPMRPE
jgi:hypothetical protein